MQMRYSRVLNAQPASNQIGDVQVPVVHKGAAIIDANQLADVSLGVINPNQGAEREGRAGCCGGVHVELLAAGGLAPVEFGSIPTRRPGPGSDRLNWLGGMGDQRSFESLCYDEH